MKVQFKARRKRAGLNAIYLLLVVGTSSACSYLYPWCHVGTESIEKMSITPTSRKQTRYYVRARKRSTDHHEDFPDHFEEVLDYLGIDYKASEESVDFECSRAELIGFFAAGSGDKTTWVEAWPELTIEVKDIEFPIVAKGVVIREREQ